MDEKLPRKRRRYGARRWIAAVLLLVPVLYIGVQLTLMLRTNLKTQTAVAYTMSDTVLCDGLLAMQEADVPLMGTGVLGYQAGNGERVAAGEEVARLFVSAGGAQNKQLAQRLSDELALLEKTQAGIGDGADVEALMSQIQQGVLTVQELAQSNNFAQLSSARAAIQLAQNQLQLTTGVAENFTERMEMLASQREAAEAASAYTPVYAPVTGYFVSAQDSEKQQFAPDTVAAMSPAQLQDALSKPAEENSAGMVGKLILDYRWRYYGLITAKQAEKFTEGARVTISFPNVSSEGLPADVVSVTVDEENNIAKVELLCDHLNDFVVTLEHEKAEITFATYDGIRIDRSALHIVEGQTCVYVQFGNVVYKRNVQILFEDSDYILVPATYIKDVNEVQLYDQIVVHGFDLHDEKIL